MSSSILFMDQSEFQSACIWNIVKYFMTKFFVSNWDVESNVIDLSKNTSRVLCTLVNYTKSSCAFHLKVDIWQTMHVSIRTYTLIGVDIWASWHANCNFLVENSFSTVDCVPQNRTYKILKILRNSHNHE